MPLGSPPTDERLHEAVAAASRRVAGRLFARYVPLYAAVACLLLISVLLPSTVSREGQAIADEAVAGVPTVAPTTVSPTSSPTAPGPALASPAPSLPAAPQRSGSSFTPPAPGPTEQPAPDGAGNDGFNEEVPPCPIEVGEDPVVSRSVAAVLLGAASPALSALGPFGPNAVPALSVEAKRSA